MSKKIRIIGVPMDLGASRRGVDMGPSALRVAGLHARIKQLNYQVEDLGNIAVKQPEEMPVGEKHAKYLGEIAEACKDLAEAVKKSLEDGFMPLILGGIIRLRQARPRVCRRFSAKRKSRWATSGWTPTGI